MISTKYLEVVNRILYKYDCESFEEAAFGSCYICCGAETRRDRKRVQEDRKLCFDLSSDFISNDGTEISSKRNEYKVMAHEKCIKRLLEDSFELEDFEERSLENIGKVNLDFSSRCN